MVFDVVIIGSGPAGRAAAITCRQNGLKTLIVTKVKDHISVKREPSESIHPGVESLLARLNASSCVQAASVGIYEGIQVGDNFTPLGSDETGVWLGNHINRRLFDSALLQCAIEQGAEVRYDDVAEVVVETDRVTGIKTASGISLSSHYFIDASGYKAVAGRKLKFKEEFLSPPLVTWTGVSENTNGQISSFNSRFTRFIPQPKGWTWIAPEPPSHFTWTRRALKGRQQYQPPSELQQLPVIGEVKVANRRWRIFRPTCKEGMILCGDAAAVIDPAAGQGILNALMSGTAAAQSLMLIRNNPVLEPWYLADYDNWFFNHYDDKVLKLKNYYSEYGIRIL